jgi:hypothetical protein
MNAMTCVRIIAYFKSPSIHRSIETFELGMCKMLWTNHCGKKVLILQMRQDTGMELDDEGDCGHITRPDHSESYHNLPTSSVGLVLKCNIDVIDDH